MKPHWTVHRQFQPTSDAQTRWDRAYQLLLRVCNHEPPAALPPTAPFPPVVKEVPDADRLVCPGLDFQPSADPNH
jgi:hypothetical protein